MMAMESSLFSMSNRVLSSAAFTHLLGSSMKSASSKEVETSITPKYTPGEEPGTPRPGSPGYKDGQWVIARPKLATPTIYKRTRSPAGDHGTRGLGETRPDSRGSHRMDTHASTRPSTPWSEDDHLPPCGRDVGLVHAWDEEEQPDPGLQHQDSAVEDLDLKATDEPHPPAESWALLLGEAKAYVEDLYLATARPRHDGDTICLRRQREAAAVSAGALSNVLARRDRRTGRSPRPAEKAGEERAEVLDHGVRLLIRCLDGEYPTSLRTRAAAALQRALIFQDVRERVQDVSRLAVAPLVELLCRGTLAATGSNGDGDGNGDGNEETRPRRRRRRQGSENDTGDLTSKRDRWPDVDKARFNAAACLRVLTFCEGVPEAMASSAVIPALVEGLSGGPELLKSICGEALPKLEAMPPACLSAQREEAGCLASIARADARSRAIMVDFGVVRALLQLVRSQDPLRELTGWSTLAAIMGGAEARDSFVVAKGIRDLEDMLVRESTLSDEDGVQNRFLPALQENAVQVLLSICECDEAGKDHGSSNNGGVRHESCVSSPAEGKRRTRTERRRLAVVRHRSGTDSDDALSPALGGSPDTYSASGSVSGSEYSSGSHSISISSTGSSSGGSSSDSGSLAGFLAPELVAKEAVFHVLLRHMRTGTPASMGTAVEVLKRTCRACSREQLNSVIKPLLDMLSSDVWRLNVVAAQAIPYLCAEDEHKLKCAASGGVGALIDMLCLNPEQMQGATVGALLSLCEHPDVPELVVEAEGLDVLTDYLTTGRNTATRYIVLCIIKVVQVCDRAAVEPFLPNVVVSEQVLGTNESVESFVREFIAKRKATDYLRVGAENLYRFKPSEIMDYKNLFKQLDHDASGDIDLGELARLLRCLKVNASEKHIRRLLKAVDKDESRTIDFDEFLDMMHVVREGSLTIRGILSKRTGELLSGALAATHSMLKRQAEKLLQKSKSGRFPRLLVRLGQPGSPRKGSAGSDKPAAEPSSMLTTSPILNDQARAGTAGQVTPGEDEQVGAATTQKEDAVGCTTPKTDASVARNQTRKKPGRRQKKSDRNSCVPPNEGLQDEVVRPTPQPRDGRSGAHGSEGGKLATAL